jgi:hypothetical protein
LRLPVTWRVLPRNNARRERDGSQSTTVHLPTLASTTLRPNRNLEADSRSLSTQSTHPGTKADWQKTTHSRCS